MKHKCHGAHFYKAKKCCATFVKKKTSGPNAMNCLYADNRCHIQMNSVLKNTQQETFLQVVVSTALF